jgi:hypothetical protein
VLLLDSYVASSLTNTTDIVTIGDADVTIEPPVWAPTVLHGPVFLITILKIVADD